MRLYRAYFLVLAAAAGVFCAASRGDEPATGKAPLEEKALVKEGASIQFPKGWTLVEVPGAQAFVFARAPEADSDDGHEFWTNININRTAPPKDDLLKLARDFQAAHKGVYADYAVTVSPAEMVINGQKAVVFGGTFTTRGMKMRNQQWFVAGSDRGYWITLTALGSAWKGRVASAEASVQTFRLMADVAEKK